MRAALVCASLLLSPFAFHLSPLFAAPAQYQDIHYEIDPAYRTAEVSFNQRAVGDLIIPSTIVVGQETYTITAIGDKAFKGVAVSRHSR